MKTLAAIILGIIIIASNEARAQESTIHRVAPRVSHPAFVNGHLVEVTDTVSLEPVYFTTQREKDSIRTLDFRDLLVEDHLWLSRHVWRTDSTDGIYRRNRIARNEVNLHQADSIFSARYGDRYTNR